MLFVHLPKNWSERGNTFACWAGIPYEEPYTNIKMIDENSYLLDQEFWAFAADILSLKVFKDGKELSLEDKRQLLLLRKFS